jgi:hypothetical protein
MVDGFRPFSGAISAISEFFGRRTQKICEKD